MKKSIIDIVSDVMSFIIVLGIAGAVTTYVYNEIASGFGLPKFNYWVCTGFYYIVKNLLTRK